MPSFLCLWVPDLCGCSSLRGLLIEHPHFPSSTSLGGSSPSGSTGRPMQTSTHPFGSARALAKTREQLRDLAAWVLRSFLERKLTGSSKHLQSHEVWKLSPTHHGFIDDLSGVADTCESRDGGKSSQGLAIIGRSKPVIAMGLTGRETLTGVRSTQSH